MNVSKKNKKKGVLAKPAQQQMALTTALKISTLLKTSIQQRTTRTFKQKRLILFIYLALLFAINAACMGKRKKAPPQQKYKQQVSSCISRILLKTMPLPVHKKYSELLKKILPSGSTTKTCEQQALENLFTTNNNPTTRTILRKFLTRDTNEHLLSLLSKKIRAETSEHIILQIFPVIVAFGEKASPIFEYLASPNSPCFGGTKSQCKILLLQKSTVFFRSKRKLLKAIYPIISDKTCTPHPKFASFFNHFILPRNESLFTFSLHLVHSHTKTATSSPCTRQFMRILRKKFKDLYLDVHVLKKLLSGPAAHTALLLTKNLPKHLQLTLFKVVQRSIAKGYIKCDSRELGEYLFRVSKKYSQISLAVLKANNTYSIGHTLTCKCLFLWTSLKHPQMRLFFQKVLQKNHTDTQVVSKALHLLKCLNLYSPEFLPLFKRILFERGTPHAQTTRMSIPRPATDYVQIIKILFNNTSPNRRNAFLLPIIKKLLQTKYRALCQETALLRILQKLKEPALAALSICLKKGALGNTKVLKQFIRMSHNRNPYPELLKTIELSKNSPNYSQTASAVLYLFGKLKLKDAIPILIQHLERHDLFLHRFFTSNLPIPEIAMNALQEFGVQIIPSLMKKYLSTKNIHTKYYILKIFEHLHAYHPKHRSKILNAQVKLINQQVKKTPPALDKLILRSIKHILIQNKCSFLKNIVQLYCSTTLLKPMILRTLSITQQNLCAIRQKTSDSNVSKLCPRNTELPPNTQNSKLNQILQQLEQVLIRFFEHPHTENLEYIKGARSEIWTVLVNIYIMNGYYLHVKSNASKILSNPLKYSEATLKRVLFFLKSSLHQKHSLAASFTRHLFSILPLLQRKLFSIVENRMLTRHIRSLSLDTLFALSLYKKNIRKQTLQLYIKYKTELPTHFFEQISSSATSSISNFSTDGILQKQLVLLFLSELGRSHLKTFTLHGFWRLTTASHLRLFSSLIQVTKKTSCSFIAQDNFNLLLKEIRMQLAKKHPSSDSFFSIIYSLLRFYLSQKIHCLLSQKQKHTFYKIITSIDHLMGKHVLAQREREQLYFAHSLQSTIKHFGLFESSLKLYKRLLHSSHKNVVTITKRTILPLRRKQ